LKEYVSGNPKIEIGKNIIAIPGDVRPEFYRLFDTVRLAFLKGKFPTLLDEAGHLSKSYTEVEEEVVKLLGLAGISVSASLNRFLYDPTNGLVRVLFDPLFNLLKGEIDAETFEQVALRNIESSFGDLYQSGYEKWVALSLAKLLASDKAFDVPTEVHIVLDFEGGKPFSISEESVPEPKETKRLSLEHRGSATFIVPDFIVHSAKINRYVSIRTDLAEANWTARMVSDKREWHHLRSTMRQHTVITYWPDLVIYIDDKPEDIGLVADFNRFCRPDIIVECMEHADWYQQGGLKRVKRNHDFLKPRLGSYIVSRLPVPEEAFNELIPELVAGELPAEHEQVSGETAVEQTAPGRATEGVSRLPVSEQVPQEPEKQPLDIHILTVGFDQSKLEPIISILMNQEDKD